MNDKRTTVSDERLTEAIEVVHRLDAALCNFLNGADDAYTPDLWHEETKRNFARLSEVYNDCHKAELMDLHGSPLLSALLTELQHRREAEAGFADAVRLLVHDIMSITPQFPSGERVKDSVIARLEALAASPSSPASGVRVKALRWVPYNDGVRAKSILRGIYAVLHDGDDPDEWSARYDGRVLGYHRSQSDGEAACQSHFDAAIRSALTSALAVGDEGIRDGWQPVTDDVRGPVTVCRFGDADHNWLPMTAYRVSGGKWERPASRDGLPYDPTHWQPLPVAVTALPTPPSRGAGV